MPYKKGFMYSPFLVPSHELRKRYSVDKGRVAVTKDTGEANDILVRKLVVIDPTKFIKVYSSLWEILPKLSKSGLIVLRYVMANLTMGIDYLYIDVIEIVAVQGYRDTGQVYYGIANLTRHNVIAKADGDSTYWVNTMMVFNGKRKEVKGS